MTREKMSDLSNWFLKLLMPIFIAICTLVLQNAITEFKELKDEIKTMRTEYQAKIESLAIDIAGLKTRLEYHEKATQ